MEGARYEGSTDLPGSQAPVEQRLGPGTYQSEVYQEAKMLREGAAHLRMVAVQGLD